MNKYFHLTPFLSLDINNHLKLLSESQIRSDTWISRHRVYLPLEVIHYSWHHFCLWKKRLENPFPFHWQTRQFSFRSSDQSIGKLESWKTSLCLCSTGRPTEWFFANQMIHEYRYDCWREQKHRYCVTILDMEVSRGSLCCWTSSNHVFNDCPVKQEVLLVKLTETNEEKEATEAEGWGRRWRMWIKGMVMNIIQWKASRNRDEKFCSDNWSINRQFC